MIPFDRLTGVPQLDQALEAGTSPVMSKCEPGDYLVVAYQDDTLFHEVYRHVPAEHEELPGIYTHMAWSREGESIVLPPVRLFATSQTS